MTQKIEIGSLTCLCRKYEEVPLGSGDKTDSQKGIAYILYPMEILDDWIEEAVNRYGVTIVVITGMDWDNVFSPWPSPGEPPGSPAFQGKSLQFLSTLRQEVLPKVESQLGLVSNGASNAGTDNDQKEILRRTLVGVSMSGLFALWQWMVCDTFDNIASLSGSFWYPGFIAWFKTQPKPIKRGKGYFLLGVQEPASPVNAFRSVGVNTREITATLKCDGVDVEFESVPGNHFSDPIGRLDKAFTALFG